MSEGSTALQYSMIIEWGAENEVYIVTVPELPGCRTHGSTYKEAVRQGQDAIESWIDAARHWGRAIPAPAYVDLDAIDRPWAERQLTGARGA